MDAVSLASFDSLLGTLGATPGRAAAMQELESRARYASLCGWTMAPSTNAHVQAGKCLDRILGRWKNRIQSVDVWHPLAAPRRLEDYARIDRREASLEAYLKKHFGRPFAATYAQAYPLVSLGTGIDVATVTRGLWRLPVDLASDLAASCSAVLTCSLLHRALGTAGDDVDALHLLSHLQLNIVVLARLASYGTGHRKWIGLSG